MISNLGHAGGQGESVLALCSNNPSSNLSELHSFILLIIFNGLFAASFLLYFGIFNTVDSKYLI